MKAPKVIQFSLSVLAVLALILSACTAPPTQAPGAGATQAPGQATAAPTTAGGGGEVTLTMGSWRVDDKAQIDTILAAFHQKYPNITIKFDPTNPPDYNATLQTQLTSGIGPDLFYLRSFATGRQLFDAGFVEPLDSLPGLNDNFTPESLSAWSTDDGKPYGVPLAAVSHGVYYNQDLFKKLGLAEPKTWEELMAAAQTIKAAGVTPFANASKDSWTMAEIVFMNLAPNFIGGRPGRLEYLTGKRCFDDAHIVAAFQAVKDIAPFLPEGQEALTYYDSQQLFLQGKAAMFFDGSWEIPAFESEKPDFAWSAFAVPPPAGQPGFVTFHLDAGMALNAASKHKEEGKLFLQWLETPEFAEMFGNQLPGFFPLSKNVPALKDEHAATFLAFNQGRGTDVRFAWDKLLAGQPDGYSLMQDGAIAVVKGEKTPEQAAQDLQNGLAQWFEPAKSCQK